MKIDPNAPVHPYTVHRGGRKPSTVHRGLPIRLELAARAMQGLLAADISETELRATVAALGVTTCQQAVAQISLIHADALIAAYNAGEEKS